MKEQEVGGDEMDLVKWAPFKEAFPRLFARTESGGWDSLAVGVGWTKILWELFEGLDRLSRQYAAEGRQAPRIRRVQEKDGILRVYLREGATPETEALIVAAGDRSEVTCEACGNPGRLCIHLPWMRTFCLDHELEATPVDKGWVQ